MIPASPVIAVDDNQEELDRIVAALRSLDIACLPVKVTAVRPNVREPLTGVRLVFFDINYLPGTASDAVLFATAAAVMERVLSPENGPYVLITWSSKSDKHAELMAHFADHVAEIPTPALTGRLAKERFTGPRAAGEPSLADEIRSVLTDHPQIEAIMHWEDATRRAAGDVICSLLNLLPRSGRFAVTADDELHGLLGQIAKSAVGAAAAATDRRGAVHEALVPILFDRLIHQAPTEGEDAIWRRAITFAADMPAGNRAHGPRLNALSHIARSDSGPMQPGDRGVVFTLPPSAGRVAAEKANISMPVLAADFVRMWGPNNEYPVVDIDLLEQHARWVFIGTKAICDQAQDKGVLRPVVLALEIPASWKELKGQPWQFQGHGAISTTPAFPPPDIGGAAAVRLVIDWHWTLSFSDQELAGANVAYRIREPMISQISSQMAGYTARPGIINFEG